MIRNKFVFFSLLLILCCCKDNTTAKPRGNMRLEYPVPHYALFSSDQPYSFQYNKFASIRPSKKRATGYDINYNPMKATIYLTYLPVKNNLKSLLKDAERLLNEHTIKASAAHDYRYDNDQEKIHGVITRLEGETASNIQFHFTDSLHYFLSGSLYFRCTPKPDSLSPAVDYIAHDIKHLAETLRWKKLNN